MQQKTPIYSLLRQLSNCFTVFIITKVLQLGKYKWRLSKPIPSEPSGWRSFFHMSNKWVCGWHGRAGCIHSVLLLYTCKYSQIYCYRSLFRLLSTILLLLMLLRAHAFNVNIHYWLTRALSKHVIVASKTHAGIYSFTHSPAHSIRVSLSLI